MAKFMMRLVGATFFFFGLVFFLILLLAHNGKELERESEARQQEELRNPNKKLTLDELLAEPVMTETHH